MRECVGVWRGGLIFMAGIRAAHTEQIEIIDWEEIGETEFEFGNQWNDGYMYYASYEDWNNTGYLLHPRYFRVNRKSLPDFLVLYPNSIMPLEDSHGNFDMDSIPKYLNVDEQDEIRRLFRQIYR